ncbi:MAG: FtsX-like permease family protein [Caldilineaceae bacterium SB0665_bin_21]|nr:FtsX-like permease family protein [Caldilineaceae bacterium SB0665_bin_21]MYA05312.1 FtsX-like permease family protein [Caldilineaceae bacterium SB0664_bin_22]MYC61998.1 FtsX-like permease family protein [Caldilineaceae bacterium SB0661_bin_34]
MNFMQPAALWMAVTLILVGLLMVALSVRSPILARLGLRNIPRRPLQSFLIVVGLTLSTTIFTAALSLGDTLNHSLRNQVVEAYGHVDQVISPAFLGTLLELAEDDDFEADEDSSEQDTNLVELLEGLADGDADSIVQLVEEGLPGITLADYGNLRAASEDEPLIDGMAGAIFFPSVVRNATTGQGEPIGFIFAVDDEYTSEFGLHDISGAPVRMDVLQPGVGNIMAPVVGTVADTAATVLQVVEGDFGASAAAPVLAGAAALWFLATELEGESVSLRDIRIDLQTLADLGLDTSLLAEQGITELSLEGLGIADQDLASLGIDPDAAVDLPTLEALGIEIPENLNLFQFLNLNTLLGQTDEQLNQVGLQIRQGDVYLNQLGAQQLNARPGDLLEVFVGPIPVPYRVRGIVQESGPLGLLGPVVMMDLEEARRLLFMPERNNAVLVSFTGDEDEGMALTDTVNQRLRELSLDDEQFAGVMEVLARSDVKAAIQLASTSAINPLLEMDGAPEFLVEIAESFSGSTDFRQHVGTLAAWSADSEDSGSGDDAVSAPTVTDSELRTALASAAVREWILDLDLDSASRTALVKGFAELERFQVLTPLSKQLAVQGAGVAGVAFGSMFTASGTFSILAGLVLIFLIYVMLAAERRSELGIVRALGMRRSSMVQMFVTEGLVYDLAACVLGLGLGLLVSWGMIDFLTGLLSTISRQFRGPEFLFKLEWSVSVWSLVVAFCLGLLLTLAVILVSSVRVSRVSIVTAIRNLPEGTLRRRGQRTRWVVLTTAAVLLLVGGAALLLSRWWIEGIGMSPVRWGATLLTGGLALTVYFALVWAGVPGRLRQTAPVALLGMGWLAIWAYPWLRFDEVVDGDLDPGWVLLDQILSAPFSLLGAIFVIQAGAAPVATLATRLVAPLRKVAASIRLAIAYSLGNRFRTGTVMFLFATVILSVIVMAYVIKATNTAAAPEAELNANFDIELTTGPLSFFDPIYDLGVEANEREDFPLSDVALMSSIITDFGDIEPLQSAPYSREEWGTSISGVDAGYTGQAAQLYSLRWRAPEYATDADAWAALGTRTDVAIMEYWLVEERWQGDDAESDSATTPLADALDGNTLPPMTVKLSLTDADALGPVELKVIGALEDGPMLADSDILVNRGVFPTLTARPPTPDAHYIKVREGLTEDETRAVAQAAERSLLSGGLNASLMSDRFTVTQAILRGMLQLFQGFLALGLITGLAGLAVISARTVVERRQQVGMLRAIGMPTAAIAWMFILESSFVALSGILVGTAIGMITGSELIGAFYTFATDEPLGIPWQSILLLAGGTYLFSVAVTALPAWQATRIYPAEALRYE